MASIIIDSFQTLITTLGNIQQTIVNLIKAINALAIGASGNNNFTGNNTFTGTNTFKPPPIISAGAVGTGTFRPEGLMTNQFNGSGSGNGADTTDDTLFSYNLPANSFDVNGRQVIVEASGNFAGNGNNKTVKVWFGGQVAFTTGVVTFNGTVWVIRVVVLKSAANVQLGYAFGLAGTVFAAVASLFFGTQTDTAPILIRVTGASPTTGAANDVLGYTMSITFQN